MLSTGAEMTERSGAIAAATISILLGFASAARAQAPDGAAIFQKNCTSCHTGAADTRAPAPDVLRQRSPEAILSALTAGSMRPQGGILSGAERRAVAEYLSGKSLGGDVTGAASARCSPNSPAPRAGTTWGGWSPASTNARFQTADQAGLTAENVPRLTLKWAFGFPDATSAWSQPTVSGGRLFVGSQNGTIYALEARTGCVLWTFTAKAGVRTAVTVGTQPRNTVFFGDTGSNVYALDVETGRQLWSRRVSDHPYARVTGTPTLYKGRLYVPVSSLEETAASQQGYECCTFRGSLVALDAQSGDIVWQYFTVPPAQALGKTPTGSTLWGPSGVGIWSAPTIDTKRNVVYVGTGNTYSGPSQPTADSIVAFDIDSGAVKWSKQMTAGDVFGCRPGTANCGEKAGPDFDFGTPPMLTTMKDGKDILVVGQKSGMAYGLDPDRQGTVLWEYKAGQGSIWGGIQWGAAVDSDQAYFPVSDIRTPTPGGLHAVKLATGERAWYQPPIPVTCKAGPTCNAALISAPSLIPGVLFSGSNDGSLRAFSTKDGSVLWSFDTNREFLTLNGIKATGGSIQGPGPTIAGGMLYLNAGYGDHLGRAGNVLLAFEVQ
jgi:polyvinyl alcohol dehydrogenase (cytochrome)